MNQGRVGPFSKAVTAVSGGAAMLQATNRISYLEIGLTEAIDALRPPTASIVGR